MKRRPKTACRAGETVSATQAEPGIAHPATPESGLASGLAASDTTFSFSGTAYVGVAVAF